MKAQTKNIIKEEDEVFMVSWRQIFRVDDSRCS